MINRRGQVSEAVDLFPFMIFLVLVGGGLIAGTTIFYGEEIDYRIVEANQLVDVVKNCIETEGFWGSDNEKFYEWCGVSEKVLNVGHSLNVVIGGKDNAIFGGNFKACDFIGAKRNKHYPKCAKQVFEVGGVRYEVVAGSNQWAVKRRVL